MRTRVANWYRGRRGRSRKRSQSGAPLLVVSHDPSSTVPCTPAESSSGSDSTPLSPLSHTSQPPEHLSSSSLWLSLVACVTCPPSPEPSVPSPPVRLRLRDRRNSLEGIEHSTESQPADGRDKCVLCSAAFSFFKRQHHCRVCNSLCCDDCSRKRVLMAGTVRV
jgi:hypothetical protein